MKVYCQEFTTLPDNFPHPRKARNFASLNEALAACREFVEECNRYGQEPAGAWVFTGVPDGDEETHGYPDYPDYLLQIGKRGGVYLQKT